MERKKRYPAPIHSIEPARSSLARLLERLAGGWNALPQHQLTRRGLMELDDEELAEIGMPRRTKVK